ncbi:hypothetical protein BS17DRAFT_771851 [Gyrodon lividus]|nr:hypothetical protein BS17DRAFT_771851 [Gyrodon lividus]
MLDFESLVFPFATSTDAASAPSTFALLFLLYPCTTIYLYRECVLCFIIKVVYHVRELWSPWLLNDRAPLFLDPRHLPSSSNCGLGISNTTRWSQGWCTSACT